MIAAYSGPVLTAPPCPLYPTAAAPVRIVTAFFATLPQLSIEIRRDPATSAPTPLRARTRTPSANYTRGPPTRLA